MNYVKLSNDKVFPLLTFAVSEQNMRGVLELHILVSNNYPYMQLYRSHRMKMCNLQGGCPRMRCFVVQQVKRP